MTSLSVGSLLDDNAWHDVEIRREQRNITFLVDRVRIDDIVLGDFKRLDLNQKVWLVMFFLFVAVVIILHNLIGSKWPIQPEIFV